MEIIDENHGDLLADEFDPFLHYSDATRGQRFLNYVIDNLVMRFVITYATGFSIGLILGLAAPDFIRSITYEDDKSKLYLLAYIIFMVNYIIYYTLCEKLFRGQTIGKLITGTKAIREDGDDLSLKDAFLRSVSRLVPFEPFSGFDIPWHDSWTNTRVVKTR